MRLPCLIKLFCFFCFFGFSVKGQLELENKDDKLQQWQIGVILSDILYPKIAGEASIYFDDIHSIGLYAAFHGQRYEQVYDEINSNYNLGLFHRLAFNKPTYQTMFFVKYGARFSSASLSYTKTDWFPYTEDGYEFLVYEARELTESPRIMSYQLTVGYHEFTKPFFVEYYLGINYFSILNKQDLDSTHSIERNKVFVESQWLREGISPILGIVVGLGY